MSTPRGGCRLVWFLALSLAALPPPVHAQYFGRNKVQYERFDFRVLKTSHFDIYFYPPEKAAADYAGRMAERWYARLSSILDHELSGRQPLILYASAPEFQQTNAVGGSIGEGTGGVTEALRRRIVLPTGGTLSDLDHVIGHELVHAFQYDITGSGRPNSLGALPAASQLPLWFIEGMAEYLSIGPEAPQTAMWMRGALARYRAGHAALISPAGGPPLLPLPLWTCLSVLDRGALGRAGHRSAAAGRRPSAGRGVGYYPGAERKSGYRGGPLARGDSRPI